MAEQKMKRVVAHPKLYMAVAGKLQHVPKGTEVTVTEAQCKALGKKLMDPAEQKKLDTTVDGGKVGDGGASRCGVRVRQLGRFRHRRRF